MLFDVHTSPRFPHPTLQGVERQYGSGGGTGNSTSNFVEAVATAGDSTAKFVGAVATEGILPTSMHGPSLPLSSVHDHDERAGLDLLL
jgi:hypothetical protein